MGLNMEQLYKVYCLKTGEVLLDFVTIQEWEEYLIVTGTSYVNTYGRKIK